MALRTGASRRRCREVLVIHKYGKTGTSHRRMRWSMCVRRAWYMRSASWRGAVGGARRGGRSCPCGPGRERTKTPGPEPGNIRTDARQSRPDPLLAGRTVPGTSFVGHRRRFARCRLGFFERLQFSCCNSPTHRRGSPVVSGPCRDAGAVKSRAQLGAECIGGRSGT